MALGSSLDPVTPWSWVAEKATQVFMEQATAHSLDPSMPTYGGPDPRHPHGLWWKQEPWTSTLTIDPDMALGGSPGPDATMASGGKLVSHSPFLMAFASLDPSLSVGHEPLSPSCTPPYISSL